MRWIKSDVGIFIFKVGGIYLLWYLVYELWLLPKGSLDQWLTTNIISVSAGILQSFDYDIYATGRLIGIGESSGIYLRDGCCGISEFGLFIGFVIAYPGAWIPRISFVFLGMGVIYVVNIIRIIILTITQDQASGVFFITHDYATSAIFYMVIFILWMVWAKR